MDDLMEWLRAQLDEDERVARAADIGPWEVGPTFGARDNRVYVRQEGDLIDSIGTCVIAGQVSNMPRFRGNAQHIALHDPARVLREVEAKRRRLERHRPEARTVACGEAGYAETWLCCVQCSAPYGLLDPPEATKWPCLDIRDDAAIYSDREGLDPTWLP